MKKFLIILGALFALFYAALCTVALTVDDRLMFPRPPHTYSQSIHGYMELNTGKEKIASFWLRNPESKKTLLYCHGNNEDLGRSSNFLSQFYAMGFSVMAIDYPGYGLSSGKPTESGCYRAIDAAYDFLTKQQNILPQDITVFGFSIGTGPSTYLASKKPVGGLILQAPFLSAYRVMTNNRILPIDAFNSYGRINKVKCPLLVIHGTNDNVIPFWHGKELFDSAKNTKAKKFISAEGAGHGQGSIQGSVNNYYQEIANFIKSPLQ